MGFMPALATLLDLLLGKSPDFSDSDLLLLSNEQHDRADLVPGRSNEVSVRTGSQSCAWYMCSTREAGAEVGPRKQGGGHRGWLCRSPDQMQVSSALEQ